MKRFYKEVTVAPTAGEFCVALDGKPIRTPVKATLSVASAALAEAVASEWRAQAEDVVPASMPLMRLACTAIDRTVPQRDAVIDEVAPYGGSDLLCYRADRPEELQRRQAQAWQPLLDWAEHTFGARLAVTEGVLPVTQEQSARDRLRDAVSALDQWMLTALHAATVTTGSLVLGLALTHEEIDAAQAWAASRVDHDFQVEKWGEDAEAAEAAAGLRAELKAAAGFMDLVRL